MRIFRVFGAETVSGFSRIKSDRANGMTAKEYLASGQPDKALLELQNEIRAHPEDPKLRIFLFQLHCVLGNWTKALTQLQVIAGIDPDTMMLAQIFHPVINCEALRRGVFEGKLTPLIFGEPLEWVGLLIKALEHIARNEVAAAAELRARAFEAAPATTGTIDGKPFSWIADADSRLGPLLSHQADCVAGALGPAGFNLDSSAVRLDEWRPGFGPYSHSLYWFRKFA